MVPHRQTLCLISLHPRFLLFLTIRDTVSHGGYLLILEKNGRVVEIYYLELLNPQT